MHEFEIFFKDEIKKIREDMIPELTTFLTPYFPSEDEAHNFVIECESHQDPTPKRVLHQIYRHINLSNEMAELKTATVKDSFRVFFWVVTIEAIYKASTPYSTKPKIEIVREFFSNYLEERDQDILKRKVSKISEPPVQTTIDMVANLLNTVRNMVAHEGIFWMFTFPEKSGDSNIVTIPGEKTSYLSTYTMSDENLDAYTIDITRIEMKDIIMKGAIKYLKMVLKKIGEGNVVNE
ncbi:hypothetical protein [Paenibacillus sp. RUD330]|uniref:hypothetical protein n=1 Tax=Paenibacillus sp. RUD330 TaxID=2023772 RepID=UPI000B9259C2|nr:hypothetical protein [Paenibacillus sp. RUD330]ASS66969.1 hypothetical protein CIC07_13130 [Paenibacillus sp. RUD330]